MAKMLTSEPMVRFQSSFFPRFWQALTKTLIQVLYGWVGYGIVKMAKNANF